MGKAKHKISLEPIGHRVVKRYIDGNGVECLDLEYTDGVHMTLKISDPRDPFFKELRKGLEDIPPLNMDEAISELRD